MDKDQQRRALMTMFWLLGCIAFLYLAYTEATGKWVTFPVATDASPEDGDAQDNEIPELAMEEENNG